MNPWDSAPIVTAAAPPPADAGNPWESAPIVTPAQSQAPAPSYREGRATVFGLDLDGRPDAQDNGRGAWGDNTRNPNLMGVSLPRRTLREIFGDENKAHGAMVEVTNPATGQTITAPIVDKGPADWTGNALDLTYAAAKALGSTGRDTMRFRVLPTEDQPWLGAPIVNSGARDAFNSFVRGALDQGVGAAVEGGARLATQRPTIRVPDWLDAAKTFAEGAVPGLALLQTEQGRARTEAVATGARDARQAVRDTFPVSEEFAQSLTGQIVSGLGQALGSLPAYAVPGLGPITSVSQIYDEGYNDAIRAGASPEQANRAALSYLPAASLDYLGDKLIIGRILKPLRGKITVGDVLKGAGVAALGEGVTEGAQQFWLNAVARLQGYDPTRRLDDEVINSMIVGGVVGGGVSAAGGAIANRMAPTPEPGTPLSEVRVNVEGAGPATLPGEETSNIELSTSNIEPAPPAPPASAAPAASQPSTPTSQPPPLPLTAEERTRLVREYSFPAGMVQFLPDAEGRRLLDSKPGTARGIAELQAAMRVADEEKAKGEGRKAMAVVDQRRETTGVVVNETPSGEPQIDPDNVPFRTTPADPLAPRSTEAERAQATKAIGDARKDWTSAPAVSTWQTVADAPDTQGGRLARKYAAQGALVEGWVEGGRVHLVADGIAQVAAQRGISPAQRAREVLLHEAVGHYGIGGVLETRSRREYNSIVDAVLKRMPAAQRAELAQSYAFDLSNADQRAALAEEYLARLAEPGVPMQTWAAQLWARLRELLRNVFPGLEFTDGDLAYLLRRGLQRLQQPAGGVRFAITAFHGTPHKIRGEFRLDRIGTGEGAQEEARFSMQRPAGETSNIERRTSNVERGTPDNLQPDNLTTVAIRVLQPDGTIATEERAPDAAMEILRKLDATYKLILDCLTGRRS